MSYIPKNIREGADISYVRERLEDYRQELYEDSAYVYLAVRTFYCGRDVNGNGTAHYRVELCIYNPYKIYTVCSVVSSGKRREQYGYGVDNEAALYALDKLGFEVERITDKSVDHRNTFQIEYKITNL